MSPYRSSDEIRAVCIVCYAFAAKGSAVCPRCNVQMVLITDGLAPVEVWQGLTTRARRRQARPTRRQNALTYGGSLAVAVLATAVLIATGVFEPKVDGSSGGLGEADIVFAFWPTLVIWFVLVIAFMPLAKRLFPDAPRPPDPPTVDSLVKYLGITIVDAKRDDKPRSQRIGADGVWLSS
jgi:hypothetical protein